MNSHVSQPSARGIRNKTYDAGMIITRKAFECLDVSKKPDGSFVTNIDHEINQMFMDWAKILGIGFIGEEGQCVAGDENLILYCDPMDGTHELMGGGSQVAVCCSLMQRSKGDVWIPIKAAIHEPFTGVSWFAEENTATLTNKDNSVHILPVEPFQAKHKSDSTNNVSVYTWDNVPHNLDSVVSKVHKDRFLRNIKLGSHALGAGLIANRTLDATIFGGKSAVEAASMFLIVKTLGGFATDLFGNPINGFQLVEKNDKFDFELPRGVIFSSKKWLVEHLSRLVSSVQ